MICCDTPSIKVAWKIGLNPDDQRPRLALHDMVCETCGTAYAFDSLDDTSCPLVSYSKDGNSIVLRVAAKKTKPS